MSRAKQIIEGLKRYHQWRYKANKNKVKWAKQQNKELAALGDGPDSEGREQYDDMVDYHTERAKYHKGKLHDKAHKRGEPHRHGKGG